ncbi:MAG: undecaprenyl/decaprenyl-phosphate alpha-N-acetylglucosaminyl 1-phosphate transferase [Clostridiaceae bacterium]|nr:undecaprenyl/decaprenyl-phosphate alpha-N-acetylglucosaminyl 1-phosphate transferase [Clostridiaceae bacterium]
MWGDIAIAFLLAFITSFVLTPYTIKIAKKIGAVDIPKDERRMHNKPIPKFGGPAIVIGFLVSTIYLIFMSSIDGNLDIFGVEDYWLKLLGFLGGVCVLSIFCFFDDIKGIHPLIKLLGQTIGAVIVVLCGIRIDYFDLPFLEGNFMLSNLFSIIVTIIWIVGITNAINLIDGLDGLSTGISIISCVCLLIIFALNGSPLIAIIMITTLVGALSGFLPFNFNPARTFIGDIGSNFIGFTLSIVSILGIAKTATAFVVVLPIIVLGLPIFDTVSAIIRRLIKGKSLKAVFQADKGHLHHKLIEKGFTQKEAVLLLYGISVACGMFAVILFESDIWKAMSFALMVIAVVCIGYKEFFKLKEEEKKDN